MLYSVQFFALDTTEFVRQMERSSAKLLDRVDRSVKRQLKSNPEAIRGASP